MKKSMLFWSFVMLAVFPAYLCAQESHEVVILGGFDKVKEAILNDFGPGHQPIEWINENTIFNDNELRQSINVDKWDIYKYSLQMRTKDGSTLYAVYAVDGERLTSIEYLKNFRPALNIMLALQSNGYKDWRLKETSQLIKASSNGPEKERYALVMTKGKEKKTIYFDGNSRMLAVQSGEHAELADLDR